MNDLDALLDIPCFYEVSQVMDDARVFVYEGAGHSPARKKFQTYGAATGEKIQNRFIDEGGTSLQAVEEAFSRPFGEGTRAG